MRTRQPRPRPLSRRRRFPPIPLADDVPESISDLERKRVEPILGDVRVMLAQPDRSGGPAFTLSATIVLASVVGGLARVFDTEPEDGKNFKNIAREYPLDEEPPNAVTDRDEFAKALYHTFRCSLVHSFGIHLNRKRQIEPLPLTAKVVRARRGLRERQLIDLERRTGRPRNLRPTLSRDGDVLRLSPDALYWGVRRLVAKLAQSSTHRATAEAFLAPASAASTDQSMSFTLPTLTPSRYSPHVSSSATQDWTTRR